MVEGAQAHDAEFIGAAKEDAQASVWLKMRMVGSPALEKM